MGYGPYDPPPKPYDEAPGGYTAPGAGYGAPQSGYTPAPMASPYQSGYSPYPPPPPGTNSLAVAALITGIASWVVCAFFGGILAVVLGVMGRNRIKVTGEQGDGMALAGIILGGINIAVFGGLFLIFLLAGIAGS